MSRDSNTQHYNTLVQNDFGYATLGDDGTVDVSTPLGRVSAAIAQHRSGAIAASVLKVGALSAGVVTITDTAGAVNAGATVWYDFSGFPG